MLLNKLNMQHFSGPNYIEFDVDISSSSIANAVTGMLLPKVGGTVIEHAFLLEGHHRSELPERVLCCLRTQKIEFHKTTSPQHFPVRVIPRWRASRKYIEDFRYPKLGACLDHNMCGVL